MEASCGKQDGSVYYGKSMCASITISTEEMSPGRGRGTSGSRLDEGLDVGEPADVLLRTSNEIGY